MVVELVGLETTSLDSSAPEVSGSVSEETSAVLVTVEFSDDVVEDVPEVLEASEVPEVSEAPSVLSDSESTEDTVLSPGASERDVSLRSPQPVRRAAQTAVHKKTVESFLIFIKNRPFKICVRIYAINRVFPFIILF